MIFIDQTRKTAAENIALDQFLLDFAETGAVDFEVMRIWRPQDYVVVLGRAGKIGDDVIVDHCQNDGVAILRRFSGGGTIVTGPGCLMYSLILSHHKRPQVKDITLAHRFVGQSVQKAYAACGHSIELQGHCDLCSGNKKFSGSALRVGRTHSIYHGTLLIDFDLRLIPRYLKLPPRRPTYRQSRDHLDFVTNLPVDEQKLVESLRDLFAAEPTEFNPDEEQINQLVESRYQNDDWNFRH